jgi:outer membrane biosynthesis protein TonB
LSAWRYWILPSRCDVHFEGPDLLLHHDQPDTETATSPLAVISGGTFAIPGRTGSGARWRAALVGSLIAHVALGAWAIARFVEPRGGRGVQLEAIEIEIVTAAALESLQSAANLANGSAGAIAEQPGQAAEREPVAPRTQTAKAAQPEILVISTREAELSVVVPEPTKQIDEKPQQAHDDTKPATSPLEAVPSEAGGAVAQSPEASNVPRAAAVGASPGDIARFRSDVRKALSRHPPRQGPGGPPVSAIVAFRVSELGRVENAELLLPSRNARTDKLLLTWITGAPMPVPPVGMKPDDRFYCIPVGSSVTQLQLQESCR